MLRVLSADERRVVLAHEAAHLARHHHLYIQLADLAAAANPLLRPTASGVRLAVERDADEVAAGEVGDRRLAARALARAGLAKAGTSPRPTGNGVALAATDASSHTVRPLCCHPRHDRDGCSPPAWCSSRP